MTLRISECRRTPLGIRILVQKKPWQRIFCLTLTLTSSFVGYFFVPGPLGGIKSVPASIESFKKNICILSKNQPFPKGLVHGLG